jgi:hypothetical protein
MIIEREEISDNISIDNYYTYPRTHTYSLSNGLITKMTESWNNISRNIFYAYDSNGYLKSFTGFYDKEYYEDKQFFLTWSDEKITRIDYLGNAVRKYEYSSIPWITGMICNIIPNTDNILMAMGYYGKLPKTLPIGIEEDSYKSFQYIATGGLVTKVITTSTDKGVTEETSVANITWD